MPIKITKSSDLIHIDQITQVIYAAPGLGKTSMAFTAEAPLLFDFDAGVQRSQFRKDSVQVGTWADVEGMTESDLAPYKTVAVDTVGRALDSLSAFLIAKNAKFKGYGGALTLQGYGALKSSFIGWLKLLHSFGKDVILVAHSDEQKNGDDLIERLDVQGGSKNEIYKSADSMARLYLASGKRMLNFSPSDTAFGKNPAQFAPMPVPDYHEVPDFFASVIAKIKLALNTSSEEALAQQIIMDEFRQTFAGLSTVQEFNIKVVELGQADPPVKALLLAAGQAKGYSFDKVSKSFKASA